MKYHDKSAFHPKVNQMDVSKKTHQPKPAASSLSLPSFRIAFSEDAVVFVLFLEELFVNQWAKIKYFPLPSQRWILLPMSVNILL